ncbi:MAG TPA: hypothetical protein VGO24_03415 [Solirubrobacterales bacterium]|jgi:hypothetical protein|nr:hypothetical protein [Solirubrobacterales bacterium]
MACERGRETANDELVRAQAQLVRAWAAAIDFGRTERALLLAADLAVVALLIVAATVVLIADPLAGDGTLIGSNAVGVVAVWVWGIRRRGRPPR